MGKRYFVWKDPTCNGKDIEWMELNGREFYRLLKQEENKKRKFICLGNDICLEADVIYIEATMEQYTEWRVEHRHHEYLREFSKGKTPLSLDALLDNEDAYSLYDLVEDVGAEFETEVLWKMFKELFPTALASLTPARREAICIKYFICPTMKDGDIAAELGISRQAFTDRKNYGLADLKKFFEN